MIRLAIFASGNGTNAQNISEYFSKHEGIVVSLIVSNNPRAFVLQRAAMLGIKTHVFNRTSFYQTEELIDDLKSYEIDFIILAGFMWLVPDYLVKAFDQRIVNIHPALLPKFGGKGMYGAFVHKAVKIAGETKTGITIHWVNDKYDEGDIIFQADCPIEPNDTVEKIAEKVQQLEYKHYPLVIESVLKKSYKNH